MPPTTIPLLLLEPDLLLLALLSVLCPVFLPSIFASCVCLPPRVADSCPQALWLCHLFIFNSITLDKGPLECWLGHTNRQTGLWASRLVPWACQYLSKKKGWLTLWGLPYPLTLGVDVAVGMMAGAIESTLFSYTILSFSCFLDSGFLETHYVDQVDFELREIQLPMPPRCRN